MRHQSSKDTPKWTRGSPEVRHSMSRDRMSPGNDRYEGRGGNKAGRSRSMEKEERRGARDGGGKRASRSDHERDGGREPYPSDHRYGGQFDKHDKEPKYSSLRVSNFPSHVSDMAIKDALFHEFKKFGEVNVRVAYSGDERFAFVNYRNSEQARDAKQAKGDRLTLFGKPLRIASVFRRKSVSPDQGYSGRQGEEPMGGRRQQHRNMGRDGGRDNQYDNRKPYGGGDAYQSRERERHDRERDLLLMPEDDPKATRTVFVGNLEEGIQDGDLRHAFERYGIVEDVDIKYPPRGQGNPFAFVRFLNLDMAHKAMVSMSGQYIGRNQAKTGYGKLSPTTRLWVGGLGPWVSLGVLEHEFDRFGAIRKIDYFKGDDYAYIQYETLEAAQAAASNMRGFPLGGPNRRLRVDFADPDTGNNRPYSTHSPPRKQPRDDVGGGYNNRYNQGRDYRRDNSPPPQYRDGGRSDQWQGSDGGGYRGEFNRRGAGWQGDDPRGDTEWNRRNSDGGGKQFNPRGQDNRRKRQASPGVDFMRDRPSDKGKPFKKRKSPDSGSTGLDRRYDGRFDSPERAAMGNADAPEYHGRKRYAEDNERRDGDGYRNERRTSDRGYSSKQDSRKLEKYDSLSDLVKYLLQSWQSHIVLKNSAFSTSMYFIGGDLSVAENLLPLSAASEESPLRITQRLRLDQPKLDEVGKRITDAGSVGHCLLLALQGSAEESMPAGTQLRALRNLVSYLQQKQAAGIISLPVSSGSVKDYGVLHAFPPCEFSRKQLVRYVPGLSAEAMNEDHLVVVIVRGAA